MSRPISDITDHYLLIPHEFTDAGEVVYKKVRIKGYMGQGRQWGSEIPDKMYAEVDTKTPAHLVTVHGVTK